MVNSVKEAASSGKQIRGLHLTFPATPIIEIAAGAGVDFLYIDGEHGSFDTRDIEQACVTAERHGVIVIARIPDRSEATITRFLDRGVQGIVVPHVDSAEDAMEAVQAAYYAPLGLRSFGGGRPQYGLGLADKVAYFERCNEQICVCIMIESRQGLAAAAEIAAIPGVTYLSFGLHDLSQSLGFSGQPGHKEVKAAVEDASERIRTVGKPIREDFMRFAWINEVLSTGLEHLIGLP